MEGSNYFFLISVDLLASVKLVFNMMYKKGFDVLLL